MLFRTAFSGESFDELVGSDADENHAADHRELRLRGNVKEKHRVLNHFDHRRPTDYASYGAFPSAKAAPAEHRARNGVQLVKIPERRGLDRVLIQREEHPAKPRQTEQIM